MDKNEYQRNWSNVRRAEALIKLGGKCVKCGTTENLEFDHIDPKTKSFEIGAWGSHSKADLEIELAKCQLLCKSCHIEKTAVTHGSYGYYKHHKCRCTPCRAANAAYTRSYRLRAGQIGKVASL